MKLSDLKESVDFYSGKTSEIVRYMAISGFAVIWITKSSDSIEQTALVALFLFAVALALDFLKYFIASIVYEGMRRKKERENATVIKIPIWLNNSFWILFILKSLSMIAGYVYLLRFLINTFLS